MSIEKSDLQRGIQLYLAQQKWVASEFIKLAANKGHISAKILVACNDEYVLNPAKTYDLPTYALKPTSIKETNPLASFTEADFQKVKHRADLPTASPEDMRNLGLCYFYGLPTKDNRNPKKSLDFFIKAAKSNDALALQHICSDFKNGLSGHFKEDKRPITMKEANNLRCDYLHRASKAGSLYATKYLIKYFNIEEGIFHIYNCYRHDQQVKGGKELALQSLSLLQKRDDERLDGMITLELACHEIDVPPEIITMLENAIDDVCKTPQWGQDDKKPEATQSAPALFLNTVSNFFESTATTATTFFNAMNTTRLDQRIAQTPAAPTTPNATTPDSQQDEPEKNKEKPSLTG